MNISRVLAFVVSFFPMSTAAGAAAITYNYSGQSLTALFTTLDGPFSLEQLEYEQALAEIYDEALSFDEAESAVLLLGAYPDAENTSLRQAAYDMSLRIEATDMTAEDLAGASLSISLTALAHDWCVLTLASGDSVDCVSGEVSVVQDPFVTTVAGTMNYEFGDGGEIVWWEGYAHPDNQSYSTGPSGDFYSEDTFQTVYGTTIYSVDYNADSGSWSMQPSFQLAHMPVPGGMVLSLGAMALLAASARRRS